MNKTLIICPHCSKEISLQKFLDEHEEKIKENYKTDLMEKLNDEKKRLTEENEKIKKKFKEQLSDEVKENIQVEYEKEFKEKELTIKKEIKQKYINAEKNLSGLILKKEEEYKKLELELQKKSKEFELKTERSLGRIRELENSIISSKDSELKGEIQEILIEDFLKKKFPYDNVEAIKKGVKGGDCILNIQKNGITISKIYFESKDTSSFTESWVSKFLSDMARHDAHFGFLITRTLPKDFDRTTGYIKRMNKIFITGFDYAYLFVLVTSIRETIMNSYAKSPKVNVNKEMEKVWKVVKSPQFQNSFRVIYNTRMDLIKNIEKQNNTHHKNIAFQKKTLERLDDAFRDLAYQFNSISERIIPQLEDYTEED